LITVAGIMALAVCFIFVAGISWWSPKLLFLVSKPYFLVTFVIVGVALAVYTIVTQVFIAFRKAGYTFFSQGVIASGLELVLVMILSSFGVFGIFISQAIGLMVALTVCIVFFLPVVIPHYRPEPAVQWRTTGATMSYSFANYAGDGLNNLPVWVVSLLVLNNFGAAANAYFYLAWTMSTVLWAVGYGISTSLFAEGSHEAGNVSGDIIRSLKLILLIILPATVIMVVFGDKLLLLYGGTYSAEGTAVLRWFSLSALPASINLLYFSLARVEKWLKSLVIISGLTALLTILLSYLLMRHFGIVGAGISRLFVQTALLFYTVPRLLQRIKMRGADINL